jgi:hypothetical protein
MYLRKHLHPRRYQGLVAGTSTVLNIVGNSHGLMRTVLQAHVFRQL